MKARLVVESGAWTDMKGQSSFDNVDELLALGIASVRLGDLPRAEAAYDNLKKARDAAPDADNKRLAQIMMAEVAGLIQIARGSQAPGLAALADGARLEAGMPRPVARPYPVKSAEELYGDALLAAGDAARPRKHVHAALAPAPRRGASPKRLGRARVEGV